MNLSYDRLYTHYFENSQTRISGGASCHAVFEVACTGHPDYGWGCEFYETSSYCVSGGSGYYPSTPFFDDNDCKRDFWGFCIEEGSSGGGSSVPTNNPGTVEPAGEMEDLIKAWEQCVSNPDTEWVAGECECTFGEGENGECVSQAETRLKHFMDLLAENPNLLIDLSCEELEKWRDVASSVPLDEVISKITELEQSYPDAIALFAGDFEIQNLSDASGTVVNMDYFSVNVTTLPIGMTAEDLLYEIRTNINSFINTEYSEFSPYDEYSGYPYNEGSIWNSSNPLGAILHIKIPKDQGSVICSDYQDNYWRFTTISAPYDWTHPVSGTREFGFTPNSDGSYSFYTRGVDRITQSINEWFGESATFEGADNLWTSLQSGIEFYINTNGGNAQANDPIRERPDWEKLEMFLTGVISIEKFGCE